MNITSSELFNSLTVNHLPMKASVLDIFFMWQQATFLGMACMVVLIMLLLLTSQTSLYAYGYLLVQKEEKIRAQKKNTIQEFILMKEIQGELEKEMEAALLNISLRDDERVS